jgi:hypothetical protein
MSILLSIKDNILNQVWCVSCRNYVPVGGEMSDWRSFNYRRFGLQAAFWAVMGVLLLMILSNFVNISNTNQLSAYDDDWDDMSAFRQDIKDMGIETRSLVSSPLLLADIEDPRNTTYIVAGVERDTLSLPQFDEDGFITIASEDGYSPSEIDAIVEFVENGGTALILEDYGFAGSIAEAFGVRYSGYQLFDTTYEPSLNFNYVWMCVQSTPCSMNGSVIDVETLSTHERWANVNSPLSAHPCALINGEAMTLEEAGVCAHHWKDGEIAYNGTYRVLLNNITSLEIIPGNKNPLSEISIRAVTSNEASIDVNGDGELWVSSEQTEESPDLYGKFNLSIEACAKVTCNPDEGGRVIFVADGSPLINAIYDYEGFADGKYGKTDTLIPENDNRKWALDLISEALMTSIDDENAQPSENAMVIFDESRHPQNAIIADSYNTIYFMLVYFTGEGLAMLVLFLILFIAFEAVLIKKKDPDQWRHVFSIIYYGFGDANRYPYYSKTEKIRQVFLSKVRNQNGLTREEFHAMPAKELVGLINDPVLAKFAIEPSKYSLEQTVSVVKRVKAWGRK